MESSKYVLARAEQPTVDSLTRPAEVAGPGVYWAEAEKPRSLRLATILEVPFKHKRLICISLFASVLAAWVAILVWPRSYESESRLKIRVGRHSVALDPSATTGETMNLLKTQEEEILSALEVLGSHQIAQTVVDKIGVMAVMDGQLPIVRSTSDPSKPDSGMQQLMVTAKSWAKSVNDAVSSALLTTGIKDNISNRELAVRKIRSTLRSTAPAGSTVICVSAGAETPEMAQAIVHEATEAFLEEHLKGAYNEGSYTFFKEESDTAEKELDRLIAERAQFMRENEIISLDDNRELLRDRFSELDRDLATSITELEQAGAEFKDLETKMSEVEDEVVAQRQEGTDVTWSGMRQIVYELELEEQGLSATLTERHPRLRALRTQLEGAKRILEQIEANRIDQATTPNPIKTALEQTLQQEDTLVVGLRSLIQAQLEQRTELEKQREQLVEVERNLLRMDRVIEERTTSLANLKEKLEQARVNEELHGDKLSNARVFQSATLVERAAKPNKKILALGIVCLGGVMGLCMAFLREGASPNLRTAEDVEYSLGVPVISSVQRQNKLKKLSFKQRNVYRQACRELLAEILMLRRNPRGGRGLSIGVIGVDVGVGASTLATNLAITSDVDCHLKTVLVDADARTRSISKMFGISGSPGLVELLSGAASHDECLQRVSRSEVEMIASSADSSTDLLSAGPQEIVQALEAYLQDCDLLIVDLPAASQPDQAVALAQHLDCIVVVAESERTETVSADRLVSRLSQSNAEVLGVVLTKTKTYLPKIVRGFVS